MKRIYILLVIFLFLITSCNTRNDHNLNDLPGITIPIEEMNKAFAIIDDPIIANSHENGKDLALVLQNLSNKTIVFPTDYGLRIFVFQNQTWNSINNGFLYTGGEKMLPTSDAFPPGLMAIAYPYIPGLLEPTTIRIVMIGHYENFDSEVVGAYLDIILK